ncbi:uncharacterized protein [Macrobrachium rosenbergii]|uniref:uncharacterized protein isoform X4 n=1 Tax=Macrobrachium rosenbergii TaxID=79674 RepID=UPI0034D5299F
MQSMVTPLLIVLLLAHWFPVTTCLANKRILPPGDIHFNKPGNMVPGNEYGGVSSVVTYIYETYMTGCHLLLITGGEGSHLSHLVLRGLRDSYVPEAILNLQLTSFDQSDALLPQLREGEEKVTCRVFLFDLTGSGSPSLALEFMDKVQLFLIRHTHVLFIGSPDHLQASLQDKTLWNSVRVLYLSVMSTEEPPQRSVAAAVKSVIKYRRQDRAVGLLVPQTESVVVYSRCLFCDGGEAGIRLMNKWTPTTGFIWNNSLLEGKLWVGVLISTASAGIVLWALQLMWSRVSGKPGLPLDISFLSTWSTIFEKPTATLPQNASGLTFLVWWWVYCTLITVVYKSSLVAHLSVPGKSPTIDSFEELLEKKGFTWGFENTHLACYAWLKYNEVPAIQKVFKKLEIQEIPGQMNRVLKGKHVLIVKKFRIKSIVAASYTNRFGYTPVYYSKAEYFRSGHGWGFRRNAPFKRAIDLMKQRLIEAGLVYHWINQMIGSPRKKECKDANCFKEKEEKNAENAAQLGELQGSSENVVLGLYHLQTVFYIFALGLTAALFAFMCENWVFFCTQKTRSVTASEEI